MDEPYKIGIIRKRCGLLLHKQIIPSPEIADIEILVSIAVGVKKLTVDAAIAGFGEDGLGKILLNFCNLPISRIRIFVLMDSYADPRSLVTHADPANGDNRIVFSRYKDLQSSGPSKGHSLKYVHRGEEVYQLGNQELAIREGQFFMVNNHEEVSVRIKASQTVEGLCLFLSDQMLREIYSHGQEEEEHLLAEGNCPTLPKMPGFYADRYDSRFSPLGSYVRKMARQYQGLSLDADLCDKSDLYGLGKLILEHHQLLQKQLDALPARKRSTREELYRRLHIGRNYLMDHWNLAPKVPEAAREAALSEYHFYRLFRQSFGQSPLQFVNQYRLEKARELLQNQNLSITEVAEASGFYDVQHFNKAYRKYFGRRPSEGRA